MNTAAQAPADSGDARHFAFWPKRIPRQITPPATSLWHNLAISALRYPEKTANVFFGRRTTYAQLLKQAETLAGCLHAIGVRQGDRVLLELTTQDGQALHCSVPSLSSFRDIAPGRKVGARLLECRAIPADPADPA